MKVKSTITKYSSDKENASKEHRQSYYQYDTDIYFKKNYISHKRKLNSRIVERKLETVTKRRHDKIVNLEAKLSAKSVNSSPPALAFSSIIETKYY